MSVGSQRRRPRGLETGFRADSLSGAGIARLQMQRATAASSVVLMTIARYNRLNELPAQLVEACGLLYFRCSDVQIEKASGVKRGISL